MNGDLFGQVATVDTGARSDFDFYETPAWMTRSLVHHHPPIADALVLEPASGRDAIANVLRVEFGCHVITNDIDPRHPSEQHYDAVGPAMWDALGTGLVDWVVGNLPFNVAFEILMRAHATAEAGVALLLRKTFLEPTKGRKLHGVFVEGRGPWLAAHPPTRQICLPRYSFRGDGSDSCAADWFIWEKGDRYDGPPIVIDHLAEARRPYRSGVASKGADRV